jgi:hypothetical protein
MAGHSPGLCCHECAEFDARPGLDGADGDCLSPWNLQRVPVGAYHEERFARVRGAHSCPHYQRLEDPGSEGSLP